MNNGFSKIWILVIAVVVIAGGVLVSQQIQAPAEEGIEPSGEEQGTADETVGWETYHNEEYGFEVKHPADMEIQEVQAVGGGLGFVNITKGTLEISIVRKESIDCDDRTTWATPCDYLCEQKGGEIRKDIRPLA